MVVDVMFSPSWFSLVHAYLWLLHIPLLYVSTISDNIVCSLGASSDDRFSRMSSKNRSLFISLNFLYLMSLVVHLSCFVLLLLNL